MFCYFSSPHASHRRGNNGGGDARRKGGSGGKGKGKGKGGPAIAGRGVTVSSVPGTTLDFLKASFLHRYAFFFFVFS